MPESKERGIGGLIEAGKALFRAVAGKEAPPPKKPDGPIFEGKGKPEPQRSVPVKPKPEAEGHIAMKPEAAPTAQKATLHLEPQELRVEIRKAVDIKAKNQPAAQRIEVVLSEAEGYGGVHPPIKAEVHNLAKILREKPNEEQWRNIQKSIRALESYSDAEVIEVAKIVRAEVHLHTFVHVVTHAREYGLSVGNAPEVVSTLRHASVARFREQQQHIQE